jgi:hypothetical protein
MSDWRWPACAFCLEESRIFLIEQSMYFEYYLYIIHSMTNFYNSNGNIAQLTIRAISHAQRLRPFTVFFHSKSASYSSTCSAFRFCSSSTNYSRSLSYFSAICRAKLERRSCSSCYLMSLALMRFLRMVEALWSLRYMSIFLR